MADEVRHLLRATFEEVPELYDRARPTYPGEIFDDLVDLARLRPRARLLEIGCGTGVATVPLAERGFEIVGVELGPGLAEVARRKLARFSNVEIVNATFETWRPARGAFDTVVTFTAFHWIDPGVRYEKSASLLRAGGALAVVDTQHVLPEDGSRFWIDVQEDYDAVVPDPDNRPPRAPQEVPHLGDEISASGRFVNVAVKRYVWPVGYTADEYIAVLETYSGHRSIPQPKRQELYDRIRRRIETDSGGQITKHYLATLNVARRR